MKYNFAIVFIITLISLHCQRIAANDRDTEPGSIRRACSKRGFIKPPPSRTDTTKRLQKLREAMAKENAVQDKPLDAYLITSDDEHQSEHVADYDKRREYISGFTGSNGDAIVTFKKAALWTDGRYHLQADDEIDCNWLLMKHGRSNVPTQAEWLKDNLPEGARIGADPKLISNTLWTSLKYELENNSIQLVEVKNNLIDLIWTENRPPPSNKYAEVWDIKYAGKPWTDKVDELRSELQVIGADAMVVTALDDIAWLLNIRGRDIPHNPFVKSYVVVTMNEIHMYVDPSKMTDKVRHHLRTEFGVSPISVQIHEYNHIWTHLPTLAQVWKCILLPSAWTYSQGVSEAIFQAVPEDNRLSKPSPIMFMKAQKNPTEIKGMEKANIRDSAALVEFLALLETEMKRGEYWDEQKVTRVVNEFRYETELGRGNSFETIAAYGPNGAKPHYETSNSTNIPINTTSTLVLDSGGQYLDGTTDVTRTLHFGTPSDEQKQAYTRVLMGCIDLSMLVFPGHLTISAADVVARAPLWQVGLDYMHGTGHGVGAFLSVHESPISVSFSGPQKQQQFKVGYFFSNEPGYYREGEFGIRLENILEVVQKFQNKKHPSGESYLGFKDVTLVPYEPKMIDYNLLSPVQRRWLNSYNTRIRAFVGADLKRRKKMEAFFWMMQKTEHIPEHGLYSAGYKITFNFYILIISIFQCFKFYISYK